MKREPFRLWWWWRQTATVSCCYDCHEDDGARSNAIRSYWCWSAGRGLRGFDSGSVGGLEGDGGCCCCCSPLGSWCCSEGCSSCGYDAGARVRSVGHGGVDDGAGAGAALTSIRTRAVVGSTPPHCEQRAASAPARAVPSCRAWRSYSQKGNCSHSHSSNQGAAAQLGGVEWAWC